MTTRDALPARPRPNAAVGATGTGSTRVQGGSRGLTGVGAACVLAFLTALGCGFDALVTGSLSWGFAIGFAVGCCWAALRARTADRAAALVAAPLVYAPVVVLASQIGGAGGGVAERAIDGLIGMAHEAPVLAAGLVLAALTLLARQRGPSGSRAG